MPDNPAFLCGDGGWNAAAQRSCNAMRFISMSQLFESDPWDIRQLVAFSELFSWSRLSIKLRQDIDDMTLQNADPDHH
jgi:hypothetical protein